MSAQVFLLDFGATRTFSPEFIEHYMQVGLEHGHTHCSSMATPTAFTSFYQVIHGAAMRDRNQIVRASIALGFLTGYESKVVLIT